MERQIEKDIMCPLMRDGLMSRHDNFIVLAIEEKITMVSISDSNQPVFGDLGQGKPPNIKPVKHG
jgi:hypothetical protein